MTRRKPPTLRRAIAAGLVCLAATALAAGGTPDPYLHHDGELRGALREDRPLPLYASDRNDVWNRLFFALYARPSLLPSRPGGTLVPRMEGGDTLEFPAWAGTRHYDTPETAARLSALLREFLAQPPTGIERDALKRVQLQWDLWAAHDFLTARNIERRGELGDRRRRESLAALLAQAIHLLALPRTALESLPDNYARAVSSGAFTPAHAWDRARDYLPADLFQPGGPWLELDFFQPNLHEDIEGRFLFLHARHFRGRSTFRVFYRFPGGRPALEEYLKYVDTEGVDWRFSAQHGFIRLKPGLRQIPAGTEAALVQYMVAVDDRLELVPTRLVQSVRLRTFKNATGEPDTDTHSGKGMNVYEYLLRRRLLFDGLRNGGLEREPNDLPQYRLVFQGPKSPDWGPKGRQETVGAQCVSCHTGQGQGVYSLVTLINQGGFDAGAMLGVAHPLKPGEASPHALRATRWKRRDETYRRLLESLETPAKTPGKSD